MKVHVVAKPRGDEAVIVVLVAAGGELSSSGKTLDEASGQAISRAMELPRAGAKKGQIVDIVAPSAIPVRRVLAAGIGLPKEIDALAAREIGGAIVAHLMQAGEASATIHADTPAGVKLSAASFAANLILGARLRAYRFDKYVTLPKKEPGESPLQSLTIVCDRRADLTRARARTDAVCEGVVLARDLVNEPPAALYPQSFAKRLLDLKKVGVKVEILDERALARIGAGGILAVGRGSANPPRLAILQWNGAKKKNAPPVALVGKGVCFDSGGLCLKKPNWMETMKGDMAGAAAVAGAILSAARRKAEINVVGILALVENMPSGNAYKPGDIVKTLAGKTIEIIDTDAEGRMILVDALHYAAQRFKPRCILDMATLTGSIIAALGSVYAGLFATGDELAASIMASGRAAGERLWRMPLDETYLEHLESSIADLRHHGRDDDSADAAHAAILLRQFVGETPWAHLDIADKEFAKKSTHLCPKGATGYGVALFDEFLLACERP
jgi:leucyl aminopeptidase